MPTPNLIKYSASTVSNTIGRNNMHLGIKDNVAYGPTSTTDFWNGYTPGASGYTIYVNKVSNGPSIFSPANDTELINTAKYIATSINLSPTITTAVQAISWINSQSNMICVNYNYPNIATDGLVALLDSSFTTSYPKGGTGWKDLSDTQATATLINGVSYVTDNSGSLNYSSASLQYVELPDLGNLSNFTVSCWFKLNTLPTTSGAASVVSNVFDLTSKLNFAIGLNRSPTSANICGGFYDGSWRTTTGFAPATGSWYSVDVTYNGSQVIQYLNGAQQSTLTYTGTPQSSGLGIRIGRRWDSTPSSVDFINGDIPFVSIYNRALTPTEISNNYSVIIPRFTAIPGVNLVYDLDAANYSSMPTNGSVINGTGSYAITMTNTNSSMAWNSSNGGVFRKSSSNTSDMFYGGPNYSSGTQPFTVFMAYKWDGVTAGRLLNANSASPDFLMGLWGAPAARMDIAFGGSFVGSSSTAADTNWHFIWFTWNGSNSTKSYIATSTAPVGTNGTGSGNGGFNGLRLFGRFVNSTTSSEPVTGDVGFVKVWDNELTLSQIQQQHALYKARFGY